MLQRQELQQLVLLQQEQLVPQQQELQRLVLQQQALQQVLLLPFDRKQKEPKRVMQQTERNVSFYFP